MSVALTVFALWVAVDAAFVAAVAWLRSDRRARRVARRRRPGYLPPLAATRPITSVPRSGRNQQPEEGTR